MLYLHLASIIGLFLIHPVTVAFHLQDERDPKRIRMLLDITEAAGPLRGIFALLVAATGLTLAFLGDWWQRGSWIWGVIVVYVAILGVMGYYGRGKLAGLRAMKDDQLMESQLERWHPWVLAGTGIGGVLIILALVVFKPI
jgi:hypothetical protein